MRLLELTQLPQINQKSLDVCLGQMTLLERIKRLFSKDENPLHFLGKNIYEDVKILDPGNSLSMGEKTDMLRAVYVSETADFHKNINHTVYKIYGVVPYAILDKSKVCSVDLFEIDVENCWKTLL